MASNKENYEILMKDVFGSEKQVFDNKFMSEFKKIRKEINDDLEESLNSRLKFL